MAQMVVPLLNTISHEIEELRNDVDSHAERFVREYQFRKECCARLKIRESKAIVELWTHVPLLPDEVAQQMVKAIGVLSFLHTFGSRTLIESDSTVELRTELCAHFLVAVTGAHKKLSECLDALKRIA
jgi:hypothetical protein